MWIFIFLSLNSVKGVELDWNDYQSSVGIELFKSKSKSFCTGILIRPQVVLTAAHCIDGLVSAHISIDAQINSQSDWVKATRFSSHPLYRGNIPGESVDVGLMYLESPIETVRLSKRVNYKMGDMCERIGFGIREGVNRRTWQTSFPQNLLGTSLRVKDEYGVVGDSGGPVYQRLNGELRLIGVHTGRQLGAGGSMLDISYVQLLTDDIWHWVLTTIKTNGF